jgi:chitin disaccharide deacetylase
MEPAVSTLQANELLGYPADARLLIINADDFGVYHSVNAAILHTFTDGIVRSTTLMAPAPGRCTPCGWSAITRTSLAAFI